MILKKKKNQAPRETNVRSWLYRIRPAVLHQPFEAIRNNDLTVDWTSNPPNPNQVRLITRNTISTMLTTSFELTV